MYVFLFKKKNLHIYYVFAFLQKTKTIFPLKQSVIISQNYRKNPQLLKNPKLNPKFNVYDGDIRPFQSEDISSDDEVQLQQEPSLEKTKLDFGERRSANANDRDIWIWICKTVIVVFVGDDGVGDGCCCRSLHRVGSRFSQR